MRQSALLAVTCLLAVAALVSADSCSPPTGTTCPPNSQYILTTKGKTKIGSCVPCPAGQYAAKNSCCKNCEGVIYTDPVTSIPTCNKCPPGSSLYPRFDPRTRQPSTTCMCPAGYQATATSLVTGVAGCAKCPAGTFNGAATSSAQACLPCPANSVAPKEGGRACTACRNNAIATADGTSCVCPANFYVLQGRGRARASGRRLQERGQVRAAKAAEGDFDYQAPSCSQCASPTQNSQQNTWPVCCESTQAYDPVTQTCVTTSCSDGASLVNGQCFCPGDNAAVYSDGSCQCYDNADWSSSLTCSCGGGVAEYKAANVGDMPSCQCPDTTSWNGLSKSCDCAEGVPWDPIKKICVCPEGKIWDPTNTVCN